jgi:hypothetical protein
LFKFSLTGRAKDWLDTIPPNTITTWEELEMKFLERYFPIHKFLERRAEINNFEQGDGESLYDAWERFKLLLKKCPNHGYDDLNQMQMFTQGLRAQTRMLLDASAGGSLKTKDENEAKELVEAIAQNEYRVQNDRGAKKKAGMVELDTQTALLAQTKLMTTQMESLVKHSTNSSTAQMQTQAQVKKVQEGSCDFCGQPHANGECMPEGSEEAKYLANYRKPNPNNNPYSNTYNPSWSQHPNFSWGGNQSQGEGSNQAPQQQAQQQPPPPRKPSPLEDTLMQFMKMTQGNFEQMKTNQEISNKNNEASIKNLETQIVQLSRQFSAASTQGFDGNPRDKHQDVRPWTVKHRDVKQALLGRQPKFY